MTSSNGMWIVHVGCNYLQSSCPIWLNPKSQNALNMFSKAFPSRCRQIWLRLWMPLDYSHILGSVWLTKGSYDCVVKPGQMAVIKKAWFSCSEWMQHHWSKKCECSMLVFQALSLKGKPTKRTWKKSRSIFENGICILYFTNNFDQCKT
jgi:hypothetical protein